MQQNTKEIQKRYEGFLQTACLWNNVGIYNMHQFKIETKSIQIKCLFNEHFNHNSNLIPENGFDKINDFTKEFSHLDAQSVFRYKDDYVWGSFNYKTGLYRLFIFD